MFGMNQKGVAAGVAALVVVAGLSYALWGSSAPAAQPRAPEAPATLVEFTADGNVKVGADTSNMPPELKQKMEGEKGAAKFEEMQQVAKYKVSGDIIEFQDLEKSGDSPFGKNNKGKLNFDGDNLTISGDDGNLKLSRMK